MGQLVVTPAGIAAGLGRAFSHVRIQMITDVQSDLWQTCLPWWLIAIEAVIFLWPKMEKMVINSRQKNRGHSHSNTNFLNASFRCESEMLSVTNSINWTVVKRLVS